MNENEGLKRDNQKKVNTIQFINTTQDLIETEGLENLSIRKIAERAGFHNSTIYLYFKDMDQLIMLASMKYFREYSHALNLQSEKNLSLEKNFIAIWELFINTIFQNPHIFYNFFFGKRSDNLTDIMTFYYDIYPEEREKFSDEIESMFFGKNLIDRSLQLLRTMIPFDNPITEDNLELLNEISVSYCKYKLEQTFSDESSNRETIKKECMDGILLIFGL